MAKKWTLIAALVLGVGVFGFVAGAEEGTPKASATEAGVEQSAEARAASEQSTQAPVAPVRLEVVEVLDLNGLGQEMFSTSFTPCQWGTICRTKRDCGNAGYCDFNAGPPHLGLCGCY